MGDIIELNAGKYSFVERLCSECHSARFKWFTGEHNEESHILVCEDCETPHEMIGEEVFD